MADRPPPSRYSVVERGGRLVVIDRDTGATPPSAAERMAAHDRRMGNERAAPVSRPAPAPSPSAAAAPARTERPGAAPKDRMAAAVADMNRKRPWKDAAAPAPAPSPTPARAEPARIAQRPQPQAGGRKTIVTGKWWDSKGPRTVELGPKGQQVLSGGFMTLFFVAVIASIVALFIAPFVFFVAAFLLFRFGGQILGPIGAGIIDKALAEKG